jgi:hypothetical protein
MGEPLDIDTYGPILLCECGTSLHDNAEARKGHEDNWHSEKFPATYSQPVIWES